MQDHTTLKATESQERYTFKFFWNGMKGADGKLRNVRYSLEVERCAAASVANAVSE